MCLSNKGYAQVEGDTTRQVMMDSITIDDSSIDSPIYYSATDSIYSDVRNRQIHLYRDAKVDNGEIQMEAGYILIDLEKNEVFATYIFDEDSNRIQLPEFKDGSETMQASSIRYNTKTKKGYIEEVNIQQDEMFLHMGVAKKHPNDEIHFKKGRFTTCDLEDPHYHFHLTKAVMVPEKRVVSGAMNLWIRGVPTPLGLPFAIIPQQEDRTHGLIFPEIVPVSNNGFGFSNLGYYLPINDRLQTTFYGTLYSRGSWGLANTTDYAKRYKYNGKVIASFQQTRSGFPYNSINDKFALDWQHRMDPKANPYWQFNSSVNFTSDNNNQNDLDINNSDYFSNTLNSNINLKRSFPGKPVTSGLSIAMSQNSISKNISLTSPKFNVNVTRFFPFKNVGKKNNMLSQLGITYNFEAINQATFGDSLLTNGDFSAIGREFKNGLTSGITVQTIAGMFKNTWKFTPSITYNTHLNFQQVDKTYNASDSTITTQSNGKFGDAHALQFSATLSTALYSYYKFVGKNEPLLRHVLTPKFTFQYIPNLNPLEEIYNEATFETLTYSPFEASAYRVGATNDQALIRYNFNNSFELKRKSDKDTITGFKKLRIIDALSFSGDYDFLKETNHFSNIRINMRVSPVGWVNFVLTSSFSMYGWDKITGEDHHKFATTWNGQLGRFEQNTLTTTFTLTTKKSREKLSNAVGQINNSGNWNADYEYFMMHPEHVVSFEIPWKVSLSHVYSINQNTNTETFSAQPWSQIQTLLLNGDVSFTKRWKLAATVNFDLANPKITNANFILSRDMHCWLLEFQWRPIGGNQSFLFSLRNTSSLLKGAKINIRKPPAFL